MATSDEESQRLLDARGPAARDPFPHLDAMRYHRAAAEREPHRREHHLRQAEEHKSLYRVKSESDQARTSSWVQAQPAAPATRQLVTQPLPAAVRDRAMHSTSHGTAGHATPHDQAMHQAVQTGKKGGKFVTSKSGKKRYV